MKLTENTKVRVKVPKHLYEAIQAELDKKHMEEGEEMNEYVGMSPDQMQVVEILGSLIAAGGLSVAVKTALQMALDKIKSKKSGGEEEKGKVNEYVGMSPDQAQVVEILGSLIAAGGLSVAVKTALQMALDKIKSKKSDDAEATTEPEVTAEEIEEAFDLNTLMEAVKDASKKKAEDKKKKELEAKKKKAEDDKKKKEAEAKKKAVAAKKK